MRVYSRCRHCQSLLPAAQNERKAFCDYFCKGEWDKARSADPKTKRASKKFNAAWVKTPTGKTYIQEPLWRDDE
jgi:sulfite reductase alpha subunit-like flavoprotein